MGKILLILFPPLILIGLPLVLNNCEIIKVSDWTVFFSVVLISTGIIALKVVLIDYVKNLSIEDHSLQLSEMALLAFVSTISIQWFNDESILTKSDLLADFGISDTISHYSILGAGIVISGIILIITAFIVKEIRNIKVIDSSKKMYVRRGVCYVIGLIGYNLYVSLFLFKVIV